MFGFVAPAIDSTRATSDRFNGSTVALPKKQPRDATRRRTREKSMFRRSMLAAAIGVTIVGAHARAETPGVTSAEVKAGATFPFSGPASPLSNTGKGLIAYINSINDRGGISGRKINLITYDDAYSPPKTVEQTRKLIESDEVAFLFGPLGTPGIGATVKYVNAKKCLICSW